MTPELTYAIGDIHGHARQLEALLAGIADHAAGRPHRIITLGDYVDRGPDSRTVLEILMGREDIIKLKGNHEQMLLEARRGQFSEFNFWNSCGGAATLKSFEAREPVDIPVFYTDFIDRLPHFFEDDLRVFVHAGVSPLHPDMSQQHPYLLLWIREPFLERTEPFFKYIVHGHTPRMDGVPEIRDNRTNLDTCCFRTGILTCGVFNNEVAAPIGLIWADECGEIYEDETGRA